MIIACDPGIDGGLALNDWATGRLDVIPMPVLLRQLSGKKTLRRIIDEAEVVATLAAWAGMGATTLFIEQVQGFPGQSAPAAFAFGQGYGTVRTAAVAAGLMIEAVPASVWKPSMRVPSDKNAARQRANEMIPTHRHLWSRAKDDGLAEAALLSLYGQRQIAGGPQRTAAEVAKIERAAQARADSAARKLEKWNINRAREGLPLKTEIANKGFPKLPRI